MAAPPPHGPGLSQRSTASIPRAAAIAARRAAEARALSSVLAVEKACGFSLSSPTLLRLTGSSAISSRSALPRRGSYARHCTEIHPQLPRRLLSLEPHRRGRFSKIVAGLRVHSFPSLTLQDLAIPVPVPVPITKESSVPHFGPSCSRALTLTQRVLRLKIAFSHLATAAKERRIPHRRAVAQAEGSFFWPNDMASNPLKLDRGVTVPSGPNVEASARTISAAL